MAAPLQQSKQDFGNSLDLVNIKTIRDNTVVVKDGSLRQILMVGGLNFALKSEMEQNIITQAYQTFLNGIDFPLQIVIHSRKVNIDKYIDTLLARRDAEQTALLQSQIEEYVEFIKGFVQKNAIMEKTFLVVVPFYPVGAAIAQKAKLGLSFFGKKKDAAAVAKGAEDDERTFAENLSQLTQRMSQVMNGILGMGLEATILNNDALVELFYNFYNPQTVERQDVTVPKE